MTKAITVRLDEADHAALAKQADELRVRPGTLARIPVHAGLAGEAPVLRTDAAHAALEGLVRRSRRGGETDAAAMVAHRTRSEPMSSSLTQA